MNPDKFGETCITDGGTCGLGGYCKDCPYLKKDSPARNATHSVAGGSVPIGGLLCSVLLALIAVTVNFAVFSGCASRRSSGGLDAPEHMRPRIHGAFNQAHADLSSMYPDHGFKPMDFRRYRVKVHMQPAIGRAHGRPLIHSDVPGLSSVFGASQVHGRTVNIWINENSHPHTLIYEAGRVLATISGVQAIPSGQQWSAATDRHWQMFPKFFRQKYRTPGY